MKRLIETKEGLRNNVMTFAKTAKRGTARRACNLCGAQYDARSKFQRFCAQCKEQSELYHFHEWLPAS